MKEEKEVFRKNKRYCLVIYDKGFYREEESEGKNYFMIYIWVIRILCLYTI